MLPIIILGGISLALSNPSAQANNPSHNLGFWVQESDIENNYTPHAFFSAMFLTPPYPSSVDIMTFGPIQDQVANDGCSASSAWAGGTVSYWTQVASLADSYPSIKLVVDIAFDGSNGGSGTYGIGCFEAIAQALSSHSSIYGIGDEGEYTKGLTSAELQTLCNYVNSLGKQCINYYSSQRGVMEPSNGFEIRLTAFPAQGDQVGTLQLGGQHNVGLASGYYDNFQFPSTFTCPIGPNDVPSISAPLSQQPQGWNQCVVQTELDAAVHYSVASQRQFLEFAVGFSGTASKGEPEQWFTGVSGQNTQQLWDNPTLRNWIWTDANYGPNFVTSTSSASPPQTTSVTISTTKSSTTITSLPPTVSGKPQLNVSPSSVPYNPSSPQALIYGINAGPPGVSYSITLKTTGGYIHYLGTGVVAPDGTSAGTIKDVFDVSNGIFNVEAKFANGAASNVVGIQIGSSTTSQVTTTTTTSSATLVVTTSTSPGLTTTQTTAQSSTNSQAVTTSASPTTSTTHTSSGTSSSTTATTKATSTSTTRLETTSAATSSASQGTGDDEGGGRGHGHGAQYSTLSSSFGTAIAWSEVILAAAVALSLIFMSESWERIASKAKGVLRALI